MLEVSRKAFRMFAAIMLASLILLPLCAKEDRVVIHLHATVPPRTSVSISDNGDVEFSINSSAYSTSVESTSDGYTLLVAAA